MAWLCHGNAMNTNLWNWNEVLEYFRNGRIENMLTHLVFC